MNVITTLSMEPSIILKFFDITDVLDLRAVNKQSRNIIYNYKNFTVAQTDVYDINNLYKCFPYINSLNLCSYSKFSRTFIYNYILKYIPYIYDPYNQIRTIKTLTICGFNGLSDIQLQTFVNLHTLTIKKSVLVKGYCFAYLKNLKVLYLSNCIINSDTFKYLPALESLSVFSSGIFIIKEVALTYLNVEKLHTLNITNCLITDDIISRFKNIKHLNISGCRNITNNGICDLISLNTLNISECISITDSALEKLTNLKNLNISYCDQMTNNAICHLENLHTLKANGCSLISFDHTLDKLKLQSISLLTEKISDTLCTFINNSSQTITYLQGRVDILKISQNRLSELRVLKYPLYNITNSEFTSFKKLQKLTLIECNNITDSAFENLPLLNVLSIAGCEKITDNAFKYLHNLNKLIIKWNNNITDKIVYYLKNIRILGFYGCCGIVNISFKQLPKLHEIDIRNCDNVIYTDAPYYLHIDNRDAWGSASGLPR